MQYQANAQRQGVLHAQFQFRIALGNAVHHTVPHRIQRCRIQVQIRHSVAVTHVESLVERERHIYFGVYLHIGVRRESHLVCHRLIKIYEETVPQEVRTNAEQIVYPPPTRRVVKVEAEILCRV